MTTQDDGKEPSEDLAAAGRHRLALPVQSTARSRRERRNSGRIPSTQLDDTLVSTVATPSVSSRCEPSAPTSSDMRATTSVEFAANLGSPSGQGVSKFSPPSRRKNQQFYDTEVLAARARAHPRAEGPADVTLHLYDVTGIAAVQGVNKILAIVGTGAFHAGVEVYGQEYSFGYSEEGTGIFCIEPQCSQKHSYREALPLSQTRFSEQEVHKLVDVLEEEWIGREYDLLRRNCCHFSDEFCRQLGVGAIPEWVTNLAGAGATITKGLWTTASTAQTAAWTAASTAQTAAIIAAAKAGKIDEDYQIRGTVTAKAANILNSAIALDERFQVTESAGNLVSAAGSVASNVVEQAGAHGKVAGDLVTSAVTQVGSVASTVVAQAPPAADIVEETSHAARETAQATREVARATVVFACDALQTVVETSKEAISAAGQGPHASKIVEGTSRATRDTVVLACDAVGHAASSVIAQAPPVSGIVEETAASFEVAKEGTVALACDALHTVGAAREGTVAFACDAFNSVIKTSQEAGAQVGDLTHGIMSKFLVKEDVKEDALL